MRKSLILWYSVLAAGVIFHITFGPALERRDAIAGHIEAAQKALKNHDFTQAENAYQSAMSLLDRGRPDAALSAKLTLELEKIRAPRGKLLDAIDHLAHILDDSRGRAPLPADLECDIRSELARMHYLTAWLLRTQEAPPRLWMAQAETARQEFAAVAYAAADTRRRESAVHNTQVAIWLERIDDLRWPLPDSSDLQNGNQQLAQQLEQKNAQQSRSGGRSRPSDMNGQDPGNGTSGGNGGRNTTGS